MNSVLLRDEEAPEVYDPATNGLLARPVIYAAGMNPGDCTVALTLLEARDRVAHVFHDEPERWRRQLSVEADGLADLPGVCELLDLALFRTVFLTTHNDAVEDSVRDARHLDERLPGLGELFCAASLDGSAAVDAWEDLDEYAALGYPPGLDGRAAGAAVAERHFRSRWEADAAGDRSSLGYLEAGLGVLALDPCDSSLTMLFETNAEVVDFWLGGEFLVALGFDPDPGWRTG